MTTKKPFQMKRLNSINIVNPYDKDATCLVKPDFKLDALFA